MGKHINLTEKEARRRLTALTKCVSDDDNRPVLHQVMFDGKRAVATDSYVFGILPFSVDLPNGPVQIPGKRLRDALRLPGSKEPCFLRFEEDEAVLTVGEETLPLEGLAEPTTVTIGYVEEQGFPDVDQLLNGEREDGASVATLTVNASFVAKLGALADRDVYPDGVMLRPRGERRPIDVFTIEGERLGLVMPIRAEQPA